MAGLQGRRVLITREEEEAARTAEAVTRRGGVPVVFPCIAFEPPEDPEALPRALIRWRDFDRIVVTSPRGARALLEGLAGLGERVEAVRRGRFFAVGSTTAQVLRDGGVVDVRVPDRWQGEGLLAALLEDGAGSGRTLLVRAQEGREVVPQGLRAAGGIVEVVSAYRTVRACPPSERVEELLNGKPPEVALFFSPSAFEAFLAIGGESRALAWLVAARVVAVGRITADALASRGVVPAAVASRPLLEEVLDAAEGALRRGPHGAMNRISEGKS